VTRITKWKWVITAALREESLELFRELWNLAARRIRYRTGCFARSCCMKTLKVSLIGSAVGTGAWMLGLSRMMWPAHPMLAVLLLTLGTTFALMYFWPEPQQ